jgi:hypothetical protein
VRGQTDRQREREARGRERADRCFGFGRSLLPASTHRDRGGLLLLLLFWIFHTSGSLEDVVEGQESDGEGCWLDSSLGHLGEAKG